MIADLLAQESKTPIQVVVSIDDLRTIFSDLVENLVTSQNPLQKLVVKNQKANLNVIDSEEGKDSQDSYVSRKDLLAILKIDSTTLWRWQRAGKIHAYRLNNRNVYKLSEVKEIIRPYGFDIE